MQHSRGLALRAAPQPQQGGPHEWQPTRGAGERVRAHLGRKSSAEPSQEAQCGSVAAARASFQSIVYVFSSLPYPWAERGLQRKKTPIFGFFTLNGQELTPDEANLKAADKANEEFWLEGE